MKRINLQIPDVLWSGLDACKEQTGTPISEIVRRAIKKHLAERNRRATKTQQESK